MDEGHYQDGDAQRQEHTYQMMVEPGLVATTEDELYDCRSHEIISAKDDLVSKSATLPKDGSYYPRSNYFSQAQWTADGTTLITNSADQNIRTFIVPPDLLQERNEPHHLTPFSIISSSESVYATSLYPGFQLQDPSTALVLSSIRDHPIRLNSAFDSSLVSSYSLVNENTEAFICPHSLLFTPDGSRFIAGSDCLISVFDIARPGSAPIALLPTITNKRRKTMGGGVGMKGIVSALAVEPSSSILAVGTFTGHVGLYNDRGEGDTIGIFSLTGSQGHRSIGGRGVTQIKWSPCGKYLYVSERMSSGVLIYDIRDTGQLLGWLEGREAMTNQRLGIDVFGLGDGDGHEIWAGGTDGIIKVWMNPHQREAAQAPSWNWRGHEDAITSTQVHPTGSVVATCSGQRRLANPMQTGSTCSDSDSEKSDYIARNTDNSLKIWDLGQSWTSKVIQDIGISKES